MGYTKKEFMKLSVSMGYSTMATVRRFCNQYPEDHEYTDNDFITVYRAQASNKSILR